MQITVLSDKFPGYQFGGNMPFLATGFAHEITSEQKTQIDNEIAVLKNSYPEIASNVRFVFSDEAAVQIDPPANVPNDLAIEAPVEGDEPAPVPDVVMTDDDLELITIEVDKLDKKNVVEGEPMLVATATNDQLPRNLRLAYLDAVMAHKGIQKALKTVAQKLKEQI